VTRLRYLTAGESHGPALTAIVEGCPAGLEVSAAAVDYDLARRQGGYGRGERQAIETDQVRFLGGVRYGRTTGAPIALQILNKDAGNWGETLSPDRPAEGTAEPPVHVPRPGHADLGGALLYDHDDIRDVIERASARETAAKVACGAVARQLLAAVGCTVRSHVVTVGGITASVPATPEALAGVDEDPLRCLDAEASARMREAIDAAKEAGDTLGGVIEVIAYGLPQGVGTYVQGDRRLQSRLAAAVFSVQAMKGLEFGLGFGVASRPGSRVQDPAVYDEATGYGRASNNAGGIEGGISTGQPLVLRAAMKPISTLHSPLPTVDMTTHEVVDARYERSDFCAVPAAGVVLEAVVALALGDALLDTFGGATVGDVLAALEAYRARTSRR
jgi:chorismate synthase